MTIRPQASNTGLDNVPVISARDPDVPGLLPVGFHDRYEVHSYRSALHVLSRACKEEFDQIIDKLMGFQISTIDMVTPGGNKSK
ncbi:MAG TPA: hypothetical protein VMQ99_00295, partial [Acetobacteraceae bacterium]|nr:hypothetical protein [Acetobacteraceae bacterium]